jgi:hypothetical protein
MTYLPSKNISLNRARIRVGLEFGLGLGLEFRSTVRRMISVGLGQPMGDNSIEE